MVLIWGSFSNYVNEHDGVGTQLVQKMPFLSMLSVKVVHVEVGMWSKLDWVITQSNQNK